MHRSTRCVPQLCRSLDCQVCRAPPIVRLEDGLDGFGDAVECMRPELMDSIAERFY